MKWWRKTKFCNACGKFIVPIYLIAVEDHLLDCGTLDEIIHDDVHNFMRFNVWEHVVASDIVVERPGFKLEGRIRSGAIKVYLINGIVISPTLAELQKGEPLLLAGGKGR